MRQVLQSLRDGRTEIVEVPCPRPADGELLIRTSRSLVSSGTERMLLEFGRAGFLGKARRQPDKVGQTLEKLRTDGLAPTLSAVRSRLDRRVEMGYCNVGTVAEPGGGVTGFAAGDRVASNGGHAEMVVVPRNLCAKVPDTVSDDEAAFTVVAAIALQGIRLARPTLGEAVVVTGLGLIGLLTVQLLRAQGCRVLGIDPDPARSALARGFGADVVGLSAGEDPLAAAADFSRGRGMDAVMLTASTRSSEPVHQAALMCRKRGRIVLVGMAGLELSRADFYEKELSFQVSCSYGPGRYDPRYEGKGQDYPVGYVRWTEQRNFEAVLDMMADGRLDVRPLITHRFPIRAAEAAYGVLTGEEASLGILLEYTSATAGAVPDVARRSVELPHAGVAAEGAVTVSFVGSGNHATSVLIPAFKSAGAHLRSVASRSGTGCAQAARRYGFEQATTDTDELISDGAATAVVIATQHDTHARFAVDALRAGKHVFVEKPLGLTLDELDDVASARRASTSLLMVGFNRRFAPQVAKVKELLGTVRGPKAFVMTVNAGAVSTDHWTRDPQLGGGRVIGEACHFVDLLRFLAGSRIEKHEASFLGEGEGSRAETVSFTLQFDDGSIGTVHYLANGHRSFPKERLDVFCGGRVLRLENYRRLSAFGWRGFRRMNLWRQDKGQRACVAAFVRAVRDGGESPIPFDEIIEVSRVTIEIARGAG